jgi:hypothetical protein
MTCSERCGLQHNVISQSHHRASAFQVFGIFIRLPLNLDGRMGELEKFKWSSKSFLLREPMYNSR